MKVYTRPLNKMNAQEYKACSNLNMRGGGLMRYSLADQRKYFVGSRAIMAWDGDKLIGWALLTPIGKDANVYASPYAKKMSRYSVQFYVRKANRRQGVGKALMRTVRRYDRRPHVIPWDTVSGSFFAGYTVTADRYRRRLIKKS